MGLVSRPRKTSLAEHGSCTILKRHFYNLIKRNQAYILVELLLQ
uniref:Uncharacterized protein n=1 Tax=Anguilla anguilla TaxID=7936 RepID=A0A0E9SXV1_ANGAN